MALFEGVLIVLGLLVATSLRFLEWNNTTYYLEEPYALAKFALIAMVCQLSLYYFDLYDFHVVRRRAILFVRAMQALGAACVILAALYFLIPNTGLGRGIAVIAAPTILFLIVSWRLVADAVAPKIRKPEKVLILGTGSTGVSLVDEIERRPELNLKVIGFLNEPTLPTPLDLPIVGVSTSLKQAVEREKVERVVISIAERRGRMPINDLLELKFAGIHVEDAHSIYERIVGKILLEHLNPSWLILSDGFRKSRGTLALKRALDIVVALVGIVLSGPLMILTAIAIMIEDSRPVLFKQTRVGLYGRNFEILKFRSMRQAKPGETPSWTANGDSRITRVGHFIRKFRLDELPQLFNVLLGDMSLVGPRPEQPYFCDMLEEKIPFYAYRHSIRPGITGWAQVKYGYGATVEESKTKLEYDLFYVKHMSLLLDLAIMFETGKVLFTGRGAK